MTIKPNQLTDISHIKALGLVEYCPSRTARGVEPQKMRVPSVLSENTDSGSCHTHDAVKALLIKRR